MTSADMVDWSYRLRDAVRAPEFYRLTIDDQIRFRQEAMKAAHVSEASEWLMKKLERIESMGGK